MMKSEIVRELRQRKEDQQNAFLHYETLGLEDKAMLHKLESVKWDFLADLLEEDIEANGDSNIVTGREPDYDSTTQIEGTSK